MAHKNIETLHHLVDYFNKDCYVFIHIDKKTKIKDETIQHIETKPQVVKIYRQYNVHWGGFSMLKCEMFLLKEAYKLSDADYFHLISGEDYPIKPLNEFNDFFVKGMGWNLFHTFIFQTRIFKVILIIDFVIIFHMTYLKTEKVHNY